MFVMAVQFDFYPVMYYTTAFSLCHTNSKVIPFTYLLLLDYTMALHSKINCKMRPWEKSKTKS